MVTFSEMYYLIIIVAHPNQCILRNFEQLLHLDVDSRCE